MTVDKIKKAVNKIMDAGLAVCERESKCDSYEGNNHLTIIGGVRRVEFYVNGTIYANKTKQYKKINLKGLPFHEAIDKAIKIAKKGRSK